MNWTELFELYSADQDQSSIATLRLDSGGGHQGREKDRYVLHCRYPWCGPEGYREIIAENGILTSAIGRAKPAKPAPATAPGRTALRQFSIVVSARPTPLIWRGSPPQRARRLEIGIPKLTQTVSRTIKVEG